LFDVFVDEFETHDTIQEEMLRMLLKRLIILCTRWYKDQGEVQYEQEDLDHIRRFHVLLEQHVRSKQTVAAYTDQPVETITAELNFREDAHFSRFFKRLAG